MTALGGGDPKVVKKNLSLIHSSCGAALFTMRSVNMVEYDNAREVLGSARGSEGAVRLLLRTHFAKAHGQNPVSVDRESSIGKISDLMTLSPNAPDYAVTAARGVMSELYDRLLEMQKSGPGAGVLRDAMEIDVWDSRLVFAVQSRQETGSSSVLNITVHRVPPPFCVVRVGELLGMC